MADTEFTTYKHPWKPDVFQRVAKGSRGPEGWTKVAEPKAAATETSKASK